MEGEWFEAVLQPRLAAVGEALDKVGKPGFNPDELRGLTADITNQINTSVSTGMITVDQGAEAAHLLADTVRSHHGVAVEKRTITVSRSVKFKGPFGRTREVPAENLPLEQRRRLYDALVEQLNQQVAAGKVTQETATQVTAQLRQQYGLPEVF